MAAMTILFMVSVLALGVSADYLPMKIKESRQNISGEVKTECDFPFQAAGTSCVFLSEERKSFDEAMLYCETLGHGHNYEVTLAMMDYDELEDQALIDVIATKEESYWVGGRSTDGINWKWLDNHNMNLGATYWACEEPAEEQNSCAAFTPYTYSHGSRAYLYSQDCVTTLNFICKTESYLNYRRIGNYYYFISEEAGVPHASWQNARDYCQSLAVPQGYHADLAVLGLPDQESHNLLQKLVEFYDEAVTWIGAYADSDCEYHWIDGRELSVSSMYWNDDGQPSCGSASHAFIYQECSKRATIADSFYPTQTRPFICQLFEDNQ